MTSVMQAHRVRWAGEVAIASAAVANYCDHSEHNELTELEWVSGAAKSLRAIACELAAEEGLDLRALYAARLRVIEARNPLSTDESLDGGKLAEEAGSWRELQLAQVEHDRHYHLDVIGLSKADQLRHYALHVAKLAGAYAELANRTIELEDFRSRRLPDTLLFGLKLSTVTGKRLPDSALADRSRSEDSVLLRVA